MRYENTGRSSGDSLPWYSKSYFGSNKNQTSRTYSSNVVPAVMTSIANNPQYGVLEPKIIAPSCVNLDKSADWIEDWQNRNVWDKVDYVSGANLVLDKPALPEFLLDDAKPAPVADSLLRLLRDQDARGAMRAELATARSLLQSGAEQPSMVAARAVLDEIERYPHGRRAGRSERHSEGQGD